MAADTTYISKVQERENGDLLAIASGGVLDVESGGLLKIAGTDKTAALAAAVTNPVASTSASRKVIGAASEVSGAEATANTKTIATGLTSITSVVVMILRSGAVVTSDAAVSTSSGNLIVSDGSTYNMTTGDVIHWIAFGA